jgi:hypothetical protein
MQWLYQAGGKPNVTEVGPYVYRENRKKVGITREGDTITYGRLDLINLTYDVTYVDYKRSRF